MITDCTPSGIVKSLTSRYWARDVARVMKSAQIGAATAPPGSPRSRLSSKPIQITQRRLEVNPENQPSREVPVFPAAGWADPPARAPPPAALVWEDFYKLSTSKAGRGATRRRL